MWYNAGCICTITPLARCWLAVSSVPCPALPGSSLYTVSSHRSFQSSLRGTYNTHSALITEHNLFLFFSHPRQVWYAINPALKLMFVCFKLLLLSLFIGLFSRTTWVSRYRRGKTSLDLNGTRDYGVWGCSGISWTICKQCAPRSKQITTPTPHHLIFYRPMLFLTTNQQCQSTEGILHLLQ